MGLESANMRVGYSHIRHSYRNDVCVNIPLADDTVVEGDETFTVSLTRLSSTDARISRVSLNPARAQVTINDDDSELL